MKNFLKTLVFLLLCAGIFLGLNYVYGIPYENGTHMQETVKTYNGLYNEPENTWDGVILGTSITDRAWVAPTAWNEYGMTIYPLATDSQPINLSTDILDEVRKRQDIKLVVLELHGILGMNAGEIRVRRVTDNMQSTIARIKTVNHALAFAEENFGEESKLKDVDVLSLYFPFIKYHSRTDLRKDDFTHPGNETKGAVVAKKLAFRSKPQKTPTLSTACGTLTETQTAFLDEFMEYADENGLEILFLSIPSGHKTAQQEVVNAALDYVAKKGYSTLNMNTEEVYEEIQLDFSTDLYNKKHLNSLGAQKTTKYLSRFIHENFDLTDKRGQEAYQSWDDAYETYMNIFNTEWAKKSK